MIQERSLSNGEVFHVATLPKGTVLFHGFTMNFNGTPQIDKVITDLFGDYKDDMYCVSPTTQRFFYPAPYLADVVGEFQIHAIYIANYDINLLMKVLPAKDIHREGGGLTHPSVRCTDLGPTDGCGAKHHGADHCLTPLLLKEHPDIHGYIAIPDNDGALYKSKFFKFLKESYPSFVLATTPMIVSDAKGLAAIPEIVVHPYRHRSPIDKRMHPRVVDHSYTKFIKDNHAMLNFTPLVYFSEHHIYSVMDLTFETLFALASNVRPYSGKSITPLARNLHTFLENALSPRGVKVNGAIHRFTIDLRTGFYIAEYNKHLKLEHAESTVKVYEDADDVDLTNHTIVPFHYTYPMKQRFHGLLASTHKDITTESHLSRNLARLKSAFNKKYIFDKGKSKLVFELEKSFPRPDLQYIRSYTRKQKIDMNYKHRRTYKAKQDAPFLSNINA